MITPEMLKILDSKPRLEMEYAKAVAEEAAKIEEAGRVHARWEQELARFAGAKEAKSTALAKVGQTEEMVKAMCTTREMSQARAKIGADLRKTKQETLVLARRELQAVEGRLALAKKGDIKKGIQPAPTLDREAHEAELMTAKAHFNDVLAQIKSLEAAYEKALSAPSDAARAAIDAARAKQKRDSKPEKAAAK